MRPVFSLRIQADPSAPQFGMPSQESGSSKETSKEAAVKEAVPAEPAKEPVMVREPAALVKEPSVVIKEPVMTADPTEKAVVTAIKEPVMISEPRIAKATDVEAVEDIPMEPVIAIKPARAMTADSYLTETDIKKG